MLHDFRRFTVLHISQQILACDHDIQVDEIVEHSYLFLKVQLHLSTMPPHSGILHGTMIGLCHTAPFIRALVIPFFPFPSNRSVHILWQVKRCSS